MLTLRTDAEATTLTTIVHRLPSMIFPILNGFLLPSPPLNGTSAAEPALECVDVADNGPGGGVPWLPLNGAS